MTDLDAIQQRAEQLIAFADGYEESVELLMAALVATTGLPYPHIARSAHRMRVVARDALELTQQVRVYQAARNGQAVR